MGFVRMLYILDISGVCLGEESNLPSTSTTILHIKNYLNHNDPFLLQVGLEIGKPSVRTSKYPPQPRRAVLGIGLNTTDTKLEKSNNQWILNI